MTYRVLFVCLCLVVSLSAQTRPRATRPAPVATAEVDKTALGALALLPKDVASRVARVEGPDGHPFPERWYVLAHDSAAPRGLREYVIADGKVLANRGLSQFADSISAEDVVGSAGIKFNNDQAAGIAAQFARHNNQQLGGINYELAKSESAAFPVWKLSCTDANGQVLGTIVLHATKGTLLGFQGFEKSPLVPEPEVNATAATAQATTSQSSAEKPVKRSATRTASTSKPAPRPPPRAMPISRPPPPQGPVDRVGSVFRRIFSD